MVVLKTRVNIPLMDYPHQAFEDLDGCQIYCPQRWRHFWKGNNYVRVEIELRQAAG